MTELRGVTWDHTRGYLPLVATAQRFSELHPDVSIRWEKRSLQQFADLPLERLADPFDLLVIDHPFSGCAAANDVLLPLDEYLPANFLADQAVNSVGASHRSYSFGGHQWALAIDAAAPVCGYRPDLLEQAGARPPQTWFELVSLAARGLVAAPGIPIDSLMHFYMLCCGLGEVPFQRDGEVAPEEIGGRALEMLRELFQLLSPECASRNPIATWELLASGDSAALCPFAYGYSNYARARYARCRIEFAGLVRIDGHLRCRSTLGGAGLAVSSRCRDVEAAVNYCLFTAGPDCQAGLYFTAGGQPGHRQAWLDEEVNRVSHDYFRKTLATLDEAYLRPRWNGYLDFQDAAGTVVHEYLWGAGDARSILRRLNELLAPTRQSAGTP